MRKALAAAGIGGIFLLTSCGLLSAPTADPMDLANGTKVDTVACDKLVGVSNSLSQLENSSEGDAYKADGFRAWGIDPGKFPEVRTALEKRSEACKGTASATPSPSPSASANDSTLVGTGVPVAGECPAEYVQRFDPNEKGNFSSSGIKNSADVIALLGHDARYLAFVGHIILPSEVDGNVEPLLPKGKNDCLSRKGVATFEHVRDALKDAKVDEDATAPADGYNTGMVNDHGVVDSNKGIGGNRASIRYSFYNGNQIDIMKRCGNPALHGPGKLPRGKTDHQRPPKETPPGGLTPKDPSDIPGNGGAGDGGSSKYGGTGSDRQTAAPHASPPAAGNPPSRYTPPSAPRNTTPPSGSSPTRTSAPPPPEPSVNPTDDSGNEGDPGGW